VARDRLQSGLAKATLVVQTGVKGGTMHAATATHMAGKPLFVVQYKDDALNNHEKCQGNAYLVEKKWATFIKGSDNLDEISNSILDKEVIVQKSLFD
jgi:DNA processing protein